MRPLTLTKPKPMLEVLGKPLLQHILEALPDAINEIIIVIGYLGEHIKLHFGNEFLGKKIAYIRQSEKLGTERALRLCKDILDGERFLMLYADDLQSRENIELVLKHPLSLLVKTVDDPRNFGVVVADERGRVLDLIEKPSMPISNLVLTGVKVLDERIFQYPARKHPNGEYYITDSIAQMARDHEIIAVTASFWVPIGYPEDIKVAEVILQKRNFIS